MIKLKILKGNFSEIIDAFFIILTFALVFISYPFILDSNKLGKELFLITITSLWAFIKTLIVFKKEKLKIYSVDLIIALFILYVIVHYSLFSFYSFRYNYFWVFTSYIILFYLFSSSLIKQDKLDLVFYFAVKIIWLYCFIESIIALLQKINFLNAQNEYFKVVGTFSNPNFLGVYMVIGLIIALYNFLFYKLKKDTAKFVFLVSGLLMLYILYLTDSRASWISLAVCSVFLIFTSEKSLSFFKTNRKRGLLLLLVLFSVCFLSIYFLYLLNKDSVDGRTLIREITISKIKEKPICGNGIFNFVSIYNNTKAQYFNEMKRPWEEIKVANFVSTSFNDYLQIIFEIGVLGFILLALLLFFLLKKTEFNQETRLGITLILVFATLGLFTSVLYNPTAMVFFIWGLSLVFVYGNNRNIILTIKKQLYITSVNSVVIIGAFLIIVLCYFKTQILIDFKTILEGENQMLYYKISDSQMKFIEDDPYVEFKFGFEKFHQGEEEKGLFMMENSIKKSPVPDANLVLANIYMEHNKKLRSEELLLLNIGIEPFRFEPHENLLRFYQKTRQMKKAKKVANDIINLPIKIESKKAHLAKEYAKNVIDDIPFR